MGSGRLDELFDFLFEHYSGKRDMEGVLSLIDTAMKRNDYEEEILYKAFLFFNKEGKYDKSPKIFNKLLEFRSGKFHDLFRAAQGALHSDDLAARTENILMKAKEREITGYMSICIDLGFTSRILEVLQDEQGQNLHRRFLFSKRGFRMQNACHGYRCRCVFSVYPVVHHDHCSLTQGILPLSLSQRSIDCMDSHRYSKMWNPCALTVHF